MKHQDSFSNKDLDNFFVWISQREEISLETRRDFLAHVLKVGYFDQKALDFIESIREKLERISEERVADLLSQIQLIENAVRLQQNPKVSLKKKLQLPFVRGWKRKLKVLKINSERKKKPKPKNKNP